MAGYQKKDEMPPVIGGSGAPYKDMPSQKTLELPPVINGSGGVGSMPQQRPDVLPPTVA